MKNCYPVVSIHSLILLIRKPSITRPQITGALSIKTPGDLLSFSFFKLYFFNPVARYTGMDGDTSMVRPTGFDVPTSVYVGGKPQASLALSEYKIFRHTNSHKVLSFGEFWLIMWVTKCLTDDVVHQSSLSRALETLPADGFQCMPSC